MSDKNSPHTLMHHSLGFLLLFLIVSAVTTATATGKGLKPPYKISNGTNGLQKLTLRGAGRSSVQVYLYGAHLTSWKNKHGNEQIFLSTKSNFEYKKPIRGGIPICFPQFSNFGSLSSHGFARISNWSIDTCAPPLPTNSSDKTFVDLILNSTDDSMKIWPHKFVFRLRITLTSNGNLRLTSRIINTDVGNPFNFTFAYHTYFSVSNISEVSVVGLNNMEYLDNGLNRSRFLDLSDAITFSPQVNSTDRIYLSTPSNITIIDHEKNLRFVVRKDGLPDAVVWNPGAAKAKKMDDFGELEYKKMVCVEAAAIEKPVTLNPGKEWSGTVELSEGPSSNCSRRLGT